MNVSHAMRSCTSPLPPPPRLHRSSITIAFEFNKRTFPSLSQSATTSKFPTLESRDSSGPAGPSLPPAPHSPALSSLRRMESFVLHSLDESDDETTPKAFDKGTLRVIIDGCHNGASVELFMADLRRLYPPSHYELWVLVGMGKDKNVDSMLSAILDTADQLIFAKSRHFRALCKAPPPLPHCFLS
jgi:hypothetical protein